MESAKVLSKEAHLPRSSTPPQVLPVNIGLFSPVMSASATTQKSLVSLNFYTPGVQSMPKGYIVFICFVSPSICLSICPSICLDVIPFINPFYNHVLLWSFLIT